MLIKVLKLWLTIDKQLVPSDVDKIRGYIGNIFRDNPAAHNHGTTYRYIYRYPKLQYKLIDDKCLLIGFEDGADIIKEIYNDIERINIGGEWVDILGKELEYNEEIFSTSSDMRSYRFIHPWLALNEENYEKYVATGIWEKKKEILRRILTGNIISIAKSVGYTVKEQINVDIQSIYEAKTRLKDVTVSGFLGGFCVNFNIPNYWGVGKSTARGFGSVISRTITKEGETNLKKISKK